MLAGGNFDDLPKINFNWTNDLCFYIISKIQLHSDTKFSIAKLLKSGKITFQGEHITRNRFDSGKSRFATGNSHWRQLIDQLVDKL